MKIKHVTTYFCDVCGAEFASESDGRAHEAACYGLTPNEYGIWYLLNFRLVNASRKADSCDTPEAQEILQTACENVRKFESAHCLAMKPKPSDWRR